MNLLKRNLAALSCAAALLGGSAVTAFAAGPDTNGSLASCSPNSVGSALKLSYSLSNGGLNGLKELLQGNDPLWVLGLWNACDKNGETVTCDSSCNLLGSCPNLGLGLPCSEDCVGEGVGSDCPDPELPDDNAPSLPETQPPTVFPDGGDNPGSTPDERPEEDTSLSSYQSRVVELVNEARASAGLPALLVDNGVQQAAQVRAAEQEILFSHTRPDGSSCFSALSEAGVSYRGAGENIAWGQKTPEEVMESWMNSSGHRANILNENFTAIGVGLHEDASGTLYWTQMFIY